MLHLLSISSAYIFLCARSVNALLADNYGKDRPYLRAVLLCPTDIHATSLLRTWYSVAVAADLLFHTSLLCTKVGGIQDEIFISLLAFLSIDRVGSSVTERWASRWIHSLLICSKCRWDIWQLNNRTYVLSSYCEQWLAEKFHLRVDMCQTVIGILCVSWLRQVSFFHNYLLLSKGMKRKDV